MRNSSPYQARPSDRIYNSNLPSYKCITSNMRVVSNCLQRSDSTRTPLNKNTAINHDSTLRTSKEHVVATARLVIIIKPLGDTDTSMMSLEKSAFDVPNR